MCGALVELNVLEILTFFNFHIASLLRVNEHIMFVFNIYAIMIVPIFYTIFVYDAGCGCVTKIGDENR